MGRVPGRAELRHGAALALGLELVAARAARGGLDLPLPLEQDRLATLATHVFRFMLPQDAGTGSLHRFSLFSPAGLAVGLALKEMRYASRRFAPGRPAIWFPHAPVSPRSFGFDGRGHASTRADGPDGKPRCLRAKCNEGCKPAVG